MLNIDSWEIVRLSPDGPRPAFQSDDDDLNEFYHQDSREASRSLMAATYAVNIEGITVAFFAVSNDSIRRDKTPIQKLLEPFALSKEEKASYSTYPAVKIGRLAVAAGYSGKGIGSEILSYLKRWFVTDNKTGCRFIIVDAYNQEPVLKFYEKNGFRDLLQPKPSHNTRLMYFDLLPVRRSFEDEAD